MTDYNIIERICKRHGAEFISDAPLAPYTTFRIGGACDILVKANSRELIRDIMQSGVPFHVLGNGSNILVKDEGIKGVVLLLGDEFAGISVNAHAISCKAGALLSSVCITARDSSLTGLEFAYGIPGSIGGAVYMNAGAYGGEISQVLREVTYLDSDGEIKKLDFPNDDFGYRKSPFTGTKSIILEALFMLEKGDKAQISSTMNEIMQKRKDKQPLEFPSAGSTFKRPEGDYASRLIDVCGLKGFTVGGAQVSEKHAGFVINKGGATCKDVLELIEAVRKRVLKETGIELEQEVEVFG
jgi:UDP-N-acetylmuramate dehydrogenase